MEHELGDGYAIDVEPCSEAIDVSASNAIAWINRRAAETWANADRFEAQSAGTPSAIVRRHQ